MNEEEVAVSRPRASNATKTNDSKGSASHSTKIDFRDLYKIDPEKLSIDIGVTWYSNLAYIQVTPRDVTIDFLQMPGVKRDGRDIVEATRVYLTHAAAQKMIRSLEALLERVHRDGAMELFSPDAPRMEPTTEAKRDVEIDKA